MMVAYMPRAVTDDWATPQKLYDELNEEFHFVLDAAASSLNHKAQLWLGKDHMDENCRDGLNVAWHEYRGAVYCNPPYGRQLQEWVQKGFQESKECIVVMLLPARTDTRWFHAWLYPCAEIRFIKGRLKYGDGTNPAPFPSMIAILTPKMHGRKMA